MQEVWKDILGYEGLYQVSNIGRVKSIERFRLNRWGTQTKVNEKVLSSSITTNGYLTVKLYKHSVGKTFPIHVLVAIAFLNHIPDGHNIVVDHKDNDRTNNCKHNLQLITHRENSSKDAIGTSQYTGVSWNKEKRKWRSYIQVKSIRKHLGYFDTEIEAAKAYQEELSKIQTR